MTKRGWHWPREEQVANAFEDVFALPGDPVAAARVKAAWAPLLPPFDSPVDPARPEFNNIDERCDEHGREPEDR